MITQLIWTTWTSLSAVWERPLNLITHWLINISDIINLLALGSWGCKCNVNYVISKLISRIDISCEMALRWMNVTRRLQILVSVGSDNGLVQMATSHYLNRCWPSTMMPYCITRPQGVKLKEVWLCICISEMVHHRIRQAVTWRIFVS